MEGLPDSREQLFCELASTRIVSLAWIARLSFMNHSRKKNRTRLGMAECPLPDTRHRKMSAVCVGLDSKRSPYQGQTFDLRVTTLYVIYPLAYEIDTSYTVEVINSAR